MNRHWYGKLYKRISMKSKAHIYLFLVNLIYAANFSIAKVLLPEFIKPDGFILLRISAGLLICSFVFFIFSFEKIDWKDLPYIAMCSLFGLVLNQLLFFKGLALTTPINGSLMMTTTPILVMILGFFIFHNSITFLKVLGILLGLSGACILILNGNKQISRLSIGDFYIFLNALSFGFFMLLGKKMLLKYKPLTFLFYMSLLALPIMLIIGWSDVQAIQWQLFDTNMYLCLLYVLIFTSFFAYILNATAMKLVSAQVVSSYIYVQPALTAVIALILHTDNFNIYKFIAGIFIVAGVYLVNFNPK